MVGLVGSNGMTRYWGLYLAGSGGHSWDWGGWHLCWRGFGEQSIYFLLL